MSAWLEQRPSWPGAGDTVALLLNRRGGRLSDRSARSIITGLGEQVGLGDGPSNGQGYGFGPHVLRHTFATQLLSGGGDPVLVADLLGHAPWRPCGSTPSPTTPTRARPGPAHHQPGASELIDELQDETGRGRG